MPADALTRIVSQRLAEARAAWPELQIDAEAFAAYVTERLRGHSPAEQHLADLALAFACASGDERALARFERDYLSAVGSYLAPIGAAAKAAEVCQVLRVRLFVPREGKPRGIAAYTGRGPLGAWLRVASVRAARDLSRGPAHAPPGRELAGASPTPEEAYVKRTTSREFRAVLEGVLSALPTKDRNLLKMHFLDGMSTDAMATLYRVDGSTVRRWLHAVRAAVERETKKQLRTNLKLGRRELDSLMGALDSHLELSISRCLKR